MKIKKLIACLTALMLLLSLPVFGFSQEDGDVFGTWVAESDIFMFDFITLNEDGTAVSVYKGMHYPSTFTYTDSEISIVSTDGRGNSGTFAYTRDGESITISAMGVSCRAFRLVSPGKLGLEGVWTFSDANAFGLSSIIIYPGGNCIAKTSRNENKTYTALVTPDLLRLTEQFGYVIDLSYTASGEEVILSRNGKSTCAVKTGDTESLLLPQAFGTWKAENDMFQFDYITLNEDGSAVSLYKGYEYPSFYYIQDGMLNIVSTGYGGSGSYGFELDGNSAVIHHGPYSMKVEKQ